MISIERVARHVALKLKIAHIGFYNVLFATHLHIFGAKLLHFFNKFGFLLTYSYLCSRINTFILKMKILIINGPNLNLLGQREPGIYGSSSFDAYLPELRNRFTDVDIEYFQSNIEGVLIDKMQEVGFSYDGIVLNAGAYTHTSIALQDCIRSLKTPVIEVHISNVHQREEFRHKSMISCACKGVILGFGLDSYRLAIEALKG